MEEDSSSVKRDEAASLADSGSKPEGQQLVPVQESTWEGGHETTKSLSEEAGQNFMKELHSQEQVLTTLLAHGCRLVGNVEVAAMNKEISAVTSDENENQKWQTRLDQDNQNTKLILTKIENSWKETEEMSVAEHLQDALQQLKNESSNLVAQKENLIEGLKAQALAMDNAFSNERLHQAQHRSQMLARITEHIVELVKAYQTSIRVLQSKATESYEDLLGYFMKRMDNAAEHLNDNLLQMMNKKKENRLARREELMRLQVYGIEASSSSARMDVEKVLLELYRLNARHKVEEEQLGFNLEVLREQFKETTSLVSEGRRRINAFRPAVLEYRRKWTEFEKTRKRRCCIKMAQIGRQKDQIQAMRSRLLNSMNQSRSRLRGLSYMHYDQLQDHIMKIHELDRRIDLTVLCRDLKTDEEDNQLLRDLHPAIQTTDTLRTALTTATKILGPFYESDCLTTEESVLEELFLLQMAACARFLVDPLHGGAPEEQKSLPVLVLEQIFWELGIQSENDLNKILNMAKRRFFSRRNKEMPIERAVQQWKLKRDSALTASVFPEEEVLQILSDFSIERGKEELEERMRNLEDPTQEFENFLPMEDSRRWSQLVEFTTNQRNKSWKVVRNVLREYHSLLLSRLKESLRVESLREENEEYNYLLFSITKNGEIKVFSQN